MNFMLFIARQLREIMAQLGFRSLDEMVGRSDLLRKKESHAVMKLYFSCPFRYSL